LVGAAASGAAAMLPRRASAAVSPKQIYAQVDKRHGEAVARLQDWIRQPSIAAENRGMPEGRDLVMRMLRDAGFGKVESVATDGHPGVFATLDAGAPRTIGLYFMYDVKQVDPKEWSSPPWDAALVDMPKLGKAIMGLRIVTTDGRDLKLRRSLLRLAGYWVSALPLGLGFLWPIVDPERRGFHDVIARTRVVYQPRHPAAPTSGCCRMQSRAKATAFSKSS